MAQEQAPQRADGRWLRLSLDWWAVIAALLLAALVLLGALPSVPW